MNFTLDLSLLNTILLKNEQRRYFNKCIKELEKAKDIKLRNCYITFFNLIVNDDSKFVKYAGNEDLINDFKKSVKQFPIYEDDMQSKVYKGSHGRKLYDTAANNLSDYLPIFNPTHLIVCNILDVLSSKDWDCLCVEKHSRE